MTPPDPRPTRAPIDGAILLGGASSRMGRDKARLEIGGIACVDRVAEALSEVCETLYLIGGDPPEGTRGHRIPDPSGTPCALRGLLAALEASRLSSVLVVATDLPLVGAGFLAALSLETPELDALVPRDASGIHPLCARYQREPVLEVARRQLAGEDLSMRGLIDRVATGFLEGDALRAADPSGTALLNVNTPDDLRRAESLLARAARGRTEPAR